MVFFKNNSRTKKNSRTIQKIQGIQERVVTLFHSTVSTQSPSPLPSPFDKMRLVTFPWDMKRGMFTFFLYKKWSLIEAVAIYKKVGF